MDTKKVCQAVTDLTIIGEEFVKTALVLESAQFGCQKPGLVVKFQVLVSGKPYFVEIRESTVEGFARWLSSDGAPSIGSSDEQ